MQMHDEAPKQMHDEAASRSLLDVEALRQTHVLHGEAQRSLSKVIWRQPAGCPVSSSSNRGAEEPASYESAQLDRYLSEMEEKLAGLHQARKEEVKTCRLHEEPQKSFSRIKWRRAPVPVSGNQCLCSVGARADKQSTHCAALDH